MKRGVKQAELWMRGPLGIGARPLEDRIAERIVADPSGCWLWTGYLSGVGYPMITARRTVYVHRWMYELIVGPVPAGWQVDHLCRVRQCVNPAHLEAVTQRENIMRSESITAKNARKTHCPQGHPYDQFARAKKSGRDCLICHRERERGRKRRSAA